MDTSLVVQETNPLKRAWISFWYHDMTRLLLVIGGGHLVVTVPLLYSLGLSGEALRSATLGAYFIVFIWAFIDNDYEQLHRIGLDVRRKPLKALQPRPRTDPTLD